LDVLEELWARICPLALLVEKEAVSGCDERMQARVATGLGVGDKGGVESRLG
jgi:hypothetical protein